LEAASRTHVFASAGVQWQVTEGKPGLIAQLDVHASYAEAFEVGVPVGAMSVRAFVRPG
jgi:hypothetical protein